MDTLTPRQRSKQMALVRSKDTAPELTVRRIVHRLGYRYRLHVASLPGCPDLVFPSRQKVIFVHGCFWHQHRCRRGRRMPGTHVDYWRTKLTRNKQRDAAHRRKLRRNGWRVLTLWECQLKPSQREALLDRLVAFLE